MWNKGVSRPFGSVEAFQYLLLLHYTKAKEIGNLLDLFLHSCPRSQTHLIVKPVPLNLRKHWQLAHIPSLTCMFSLWIIGFIHMVSLQNEELINLQTSKI